MAKGKNKDHSLDHSGSEFNNKIFEKGILDLVKQAGGIGSLYSSAGGAGNVAQMIIKPFYEALLKAEIDDHLGYEKNEHSSSRGVNARNGTGRKKIRGDFGEVEIESPRDRDGSFDPQIIKKRQNEVGDFSDKIISLYSRGMTTREIESHLLEMYGIEISPQFVSRATASVWESVVEWQGRRLNQVYPVVYVDGLRVATRTGDNRGAVQHKCVYVVLGIDKSGCQEVLGLWIEETEGAKFWLQVFTDLKSRGVEDILILCGDGLKGLPEAVFSVFPKTDVQLCIVHQIRNACKFVPYKDRREFCKDMKLLYTSPTIEMAEVALRNLESKWNHKYKVAIDSWNRNWDLFTTFYKYPQELRTIIYTTNSIESLNSQLRKNISNRKVFPNNEALVKILYLNIINFTKKWTKRKNWDSIYSQLVIMFGDRINPTEDSIQIGM